MSLPGAGGGLLDLDEALARFQQGDFEYAGGLSNHGPMAAEALVALGHGSLIPAFADVYAPRLPPLPEGRPIPTPERAAALGMQARRSDWLASFEADLDGQPWRRVLADAVPPLLAGLFAAAGHGLLRVAHAARALEREETAVRRRELAFGLAYWAASHSALPGRPGAAPRRGTGPVQVMSAISPVAPARRIPGLFTAAIDALEGDGCFVGAVESLDLDARPPLDLVAELCRHSAQLYLANPQSRIAYAHAITVPSALRLLAPLLDEEALRRATGFAIQAVAALHAVSAAEQVAPPTRDPEVERLAGDSAEIGYRAACSLEEHAIKLAEACLREDTLEPDRSLRLAAADAALRL